MKSIKVLNSAVIFLVTILFINCQKKSLSAQEYISFVQDPSNNLKKEKVIDELKFAIQYKPVEYICLYEEKIKPDESEKIRMRKIKLQGAHYFTLRLESAKAKNGLVTGANSDDATFGDRLNYLTYGMQQDLNLKVGNDTLPCALYHYVRNFELAPFVDIVFSFNPKTQNNSDDIELILDDTSLGVGRLKFLFKRKDIDEVSSLTAR